jgi:hypothetical protein
VGAEKAAVESIVFAGPQSLRDPRERIAFWMTTLCSLPAALAIGYVLHESIGASQVALFIVIAMVYVTLARGRLLGTSVRVHELQYPRVFSIVKSACAALDIPMPLVFVREDNFVPVAALGFGEPYSLVLSSHWIEVFDDDELAFMIGRELGHIAVGHTRFLSLLSVNGKENPLIALIFGAWLRRCAAISSDSSVAAIWTRRSGPSASQSFTSSDAKSTTTHSPNSTPNSKRTAFRVGAYGSAPNRTRPRVSHRCASSYRRRCTIRRAPGSCASETRNRRYSRLQAS